MDYTIEYNIWKVKYLLSYNQNNKIHPDGSLFYDVKTFKNKKDLNIFIKKIFWQIKKIMIQL